MIKNREKNIFNKAIFLLFFILANLNCFGWFGSEGVNKAIKEHNELYSKFVPERESTDIKVEPILSKIIPSATIAFRYSPETRHLKAYFDSFGKLEISVIQTSQLKALIFGSILGILNVYGLFNYDQALKLFLGSLIAALVASIVNTIKENKAYGKHLYFDRFLKKHDNYFDNFNSPSSTRALITYLTSLSSGAIMYMICFMLKIKFEEL